MIIQPCNFSDPQVLDLLRKHLADMRATSPPGCVHALDLSGLQSPDVTFWAAWEGKALLGFGALRELTPATGEIKSMRTATAQLRRGVAARLLEHMIATARSRGYSQLSLETGTGPAFEPALALYRRYGFVNGEAFGDYVRTDFNQFLHLAL